MSRKGKDLEIPAHSGMLVRMDNTITMPATGPNSTGSR
jgi:hypothetical protein